MAIVDSNDLNQLVIDRCSFFANRVDVYARAMNLDNKEVVEHLLQLAITYGERRITGIIDVHMPPHLHSSRMPAL